MKTEWYDRTIQALQLNGKGERTQQAYARSVRMLSQFYGKAPDLITEQELQDYFLHRKNVDHWSPNTMRICYCGIRFFYEHVLQRNWHILGILRAQTERRLPAVLSVEEVRSILAQVKTFQNYAYLSTVYSCGLRLHEGLYLEVSDIDSTRMMIHVHRGKGAKDRYVPLPPSTLNLLRRYWVTHRHPCLLFPALGRNGNGAKDAPSPMAKSSVQGAFRRAKVAAGIRKKGGLRSHPAPLLCHPSPRSRRQPAGHPTIHGPCPARNHHGLSPPYPKGSGGCLSVDQSGDGGAGP